MSYEAITVIALQFLVIVALMVECAILARQKRLSDEAMEYWQARAHDAVRAGEVLNNHDGSFESAYECDNRYEPNDMY